MIELHVECYAGYRAEETPRRFYLQKKLIEVVEVIDRWLAPDHRYFKVLGSDNAVYLLRHDVANEKWDLVVFDANL